MGEVTAIAWTDHTFNAWHGCTKVSPACDNCYAETQSVRYGLQIWGKDTDRRHLSERNWSKPIQWDRAAAERGRPALVFCASMSDVFEPRDDLDRDRERLWDLIERTPHLIWQLLTKRPEQILRRVPFAWDDNWPSNVWVGTSVESEEYARIRIPRLLRVPAPVRFLSCEPLLGYVNLRRWLADPGLNGFRYECQLHGMPECEQLPECRGVQWVIVGGESGAGHRRLDLDVAREMRDECATAAVPFFFKQIDGFKSGLQGPPDLMVRQFPDEARRAA